MNATDLLWRLFPGRCALCRVPSRRDLDLCAHCEADLSLNAEACARCALPLSVGTLCGRCATAPPAFYRALVPYRYTPPLTGLIHGLKKGQGLLQAKILARLLTPALRATYAEQAFPDVVIPLPATYRRRVRRGYNQAALLSRYVGRSLGIPVSYRTLHRIRHGRPQRGLSAQDRIRNVRNAFTSDPIDAIKVALVDDVLTTGATADAASRALLSSGADDVHVWMIARAVLIH